MKKSQTKIYVDAAASALKSKDVVKAEADFLLHNYANAGRGLCARANYVDSMILNARQTIAKFINVSKNSAKDKVVFTSGTTDGMNRIAQMLSRDVLKPNSVVIVSDLDHHSARLPFEELAFRGKCKIWVCPLTKDNLIDKIALHSRCAKGDVAAVIVSAMSNVLGQNQNVKEIVRATKIKKESPIVIIDAAQSAVHGNINVSDWDADAVVFSGHKIGADSGIGVMYLKNPDKWTPSDFGGGMVSGVYKKQNGTTSWNLASGVQKFEAGTLPLTQIIGLDVAAKEMMGRKKDLRPKLLEIVRAGISKNKRIKIISPKKSAILTFIVKDMHPLDFGIMAGANGVCLRAGNMCASWIHSKLGIQGSIRISVGNWNTESEMKQLVKIINKIAK